MLSISAGAGCGVLQHSSSHKCALLNQILFDVKEYFIQNGNGYYVSMTTWLEALDGSSHDL